MSVRRHAVLLVLTQAFSMVIGIIAGIFITRLLGPEGKGVYAKLNASIGLLNLLLGLSTSIGLVYFSANKKIKISKVMGIGILSVVISTILIFAIYVILNLLSLEHLILPANYKIGIVVIFLVVMSFVNRMNNSTYSVFRGLTLFNTTYIITIVTNLTSLALFAILYFKNQSSAFADPIKTVLIAQMLLGAFILLMWFVASKKKINKSPSFDLSFQEHIRPFYKYALVGHATFILTFLNQKFDIWLVEAYTDAKQLGLYATAVGVTQIVLALPQTIRQVLLPYLVKGDKKNNIEDLTLFSKLNGTVAIGITVFLFFIAEWFIVKAYGDAFSDSVRPLLFLLPGIVFLSYKATFATYNFSQNTIRFNLYGNIIGFALMVIINLVLLPKIGILGAAIASSISYAISSLFIIFASIKVHKLPMKNYFLLTPNDIGQIFQQVKQKMKRN